MAAEWRTRIVGLLRGVRRRDARPGAGRPLDVSHRDRAGRTPLHYAVTDGPSDLAFLALTGAEERRDVLRRFIIANTARCLAQPSVDVDARDDDGNRPLHWAARQEFSDAVQILLDAGADPNPQSHNGTTPLYVAAGNTSAAGVTIVHVLLAAGADPTVRMVNGSSAVRLARRRGAQRVLDAFAGYGYS